MHAKIENVAKSCNITTLKTAQNIELHVFWVFRKLLEAVKKSCKSCKNLPYSWGKIWFCLGGSGLNRTGNFQKFCGAGLDRIQVHQDWTRTEKFHSPLISAACSVFSFATAVGVSFFSLDLVFLFYLGFWEFLTLVKF